MTWDAIPLRPVWVEVNLGAIENNARRLAQIAGPAELLAIVKANAYGHGAVEASRAALRGGAKWLGVVSVGEGIELRQAGIAAPILVTGVTPSEWMRAAVAHDLALVTFTLDGACALAAAARDLARRARVHIKIDTGMSRLGVLPSEALDLARAVRELPNVEIEGVMTHFSMADTPDAYGVAGWGEAFTQTQLTRFREVLRAFDQAGIPVRYRHCANSPATLNIAEARFNLVRSGILIYGLDPSDHVPHPAGFMPALSFKTRIASVRDLPVGAYIGYGCTVRVDKPMRVAVIMVGYADGFRRQLANTGVVLVRGQRAPVIARVCMDQSFVDVTHISAAQPGDEVVLIGKQGAEEIRAEEAAEKQGTNNYETVATISARVERRYV